MLSRLEDYRDKKYISFHTPCHMGRNKLLNRALKSSLDLTELEETDNLFSEEGCIKALEEKMACVLSGDVFYPLCNGATSGVMAALSVFSEGDKVLFDRNSHISAVNGIRMYRINPVFINTTLNDFNIPNPPKVCEVIKAIEENPDVKGIFITNPNYYGMSAKLSEIIAIAKEKKLIIIVDEAHGTHLRYIDKNPLKPDISILSFHKNLPALTQTGGILINNKSLSGKVKSALRCFTSTSPSYLFMLSIDAMNIYMEREGRAKLSEYLNYLTAVKKELSDKGVKVLTDNDAFKIVVNTKEAAKKAELIKKKYKIVPEMCDRENITFIVSIHNYIKEIELLKKALYEFCTEKGTAHLNFVLPKKALTPYEVSLRKTETVPMKEAIGRISAQTIIDFPPSIPIVCEGEIIDENVIGLIKNKTVECVKYEL